MVNAAVIGLGKMGISHLAILNSHPHVNVYAVCDTSNFLIGCMDKVTDFTFYSDYKKMFEECDLDCVLIATPSAFHSPILEESLKRNLHIFVEKPFSLNIKDSERFTLEADKRGLVNQVGYHNKFLGTFSKVYELLRENILGELYHIFGEAYGPVVLKDKGSTWRTKKKEGGGCLHDYASHVLDLLNYYVGAPSLVSGSQLVKIFSSDVEDAVFASLFYPSGITGQISVNWSEPTYRKMSTTITIMGKKGKIVVDRQECKIFLTERHNSSGLETGWTVLYTTDLTKPVNFYLRGEEYSAQIDYFVNCITGKQSAGMNSFRSAAETDRVIDMIIEDARENGKR